MKHIDAERRKKGIRMVGIAVALMMAPVCALAQPVATATSQAPVYRQAVPPAAYYYGPGPGYYAPAMMGGLGLFWGLLWLLVLVGIVGGAAFLIRGAFICRHRHGCRDGVNGNGGAPANSWTNAMRVAKSSVMNILKSGTIWGNEQARGMAGATGPLGTPDYPTSASEGLAVRNSVFP